MIVVDAVGDRGSTASRSAASVWTARTRSRTELRRGEVEAVGGGDVLLERVGLAGDGEEVEDPATVVVQQHDREGSRRRPAASSPPMS